MRLYERHFEIPIVSGHKGLFNYFEDVIKKYLKKDEIPIRLAVTKTDATHYHCELGIMSWRLNGSQPKPPSIFEFKLREYENTEQFNAVLIIPTGVGAEIGGHAGDAGRFTTKLLGSVCDNLITHPNVVNASDINEMPSNGLYVEGSMMCRFLMGMVGLQKIRSNRVLLLMDKHRCQAYNTLTINALNAARACYGLSCPHIVELTPRTAEYTQAGRAAGYVDGIERIIEIFNEYRDEYDAVALSTIISVPYDLHLKYFKSGGKIINPWGGVEAIFTHALSLLYNVPTAHSPMLESDDIEELDPGIVDPRMAAEAVSYTFLQCILKGLQRSPRIITDPFMKSRPGVLTANDVSCVIIPDGCMGLPTLAALEQGIPVIAVRENKNLMRNDLSKLPWAPGQFFIAKSYLEAVGIMSAIKSGTAIEALRRPIKMAPIDIYNLTKPKNIKLNEVASESRVSVEQTVVPFFDNGATKRLCNDD